MSNHLYDALMASKPNENSPFLLLDERGNRGTLSFREFEALTAQVAHTLVSQGVTPGDRVVVQAPKRSEILALYVATIQVGAVFLPLNTAYKLSELTYFIQDSTPKLIVCTPSAEAALLPIAADVGAAVMTIDADGGGSLLEDSNAQPTIFTTVARAADDLAALLYTSGTTGRSKGAMLSHDNLLSNAQVLTDLWQITGEDVLIHALPVFHTHGLFVAMNTALLAGAQVNFMSSFDLDNIIEALPSSTLLMGVPTFYTRLLNDDRLSSDLVANMRLFISGSAPLLAETHDLFTERTGHRILERYGMTETNMNTSNPYDGERRAGTVGIPLPGTEVRLTSVSGEMVTDSSVGMIEVRGPNVFLGYWNMPEKTAEELRADGFFITGDLGEFSSDGYLSIVGRQKDLIITGGFNVYPKEIEDVLNDITGIQESAAFGVPDSDFGEAIVAAVVAEPNAVLDTHSIQDVVNERLARFKHPRRFEVVTELPRNTMGKVQKNVLREKYSSDTDD